MRVELDPKTDDLPGQIVMRAAWGVTSSVTGRFALVGARGRGASGLVRPMGR